MSDLENNEYSKMQIAEYTKFANEGAFKVIGNDESRLNDWPDWEILFEGMDLSDKRGLDFACGPGRNIRLFGNRFKQLDGVDLSQTILDLARTSLSDYSKPCELILCNGYNLDTIESNTYDVIMSAIALQHICVYDIRYNYFQEFYRTLKRGGWLTFQMGFGDRIGGVEYLDNQFDAIGTNGDRDVQVRDPAQLERDLRDIGFKNISHQIRPCHPTDIHSNWIFVRAQK